MKVTIDPHILSTNYVQQKLMSSPDTTIKTSIVKQSHSMWSKQDLLISTADSYFVIPNICDDRGYLYKTYVVKQYVICCLYGTGGFTLDQQYFRIVCLNTVKNNAYTYNIDIKRSGIVTTGFDESEILTVVEKSDNDKYFTIYRFTFDSEEKSQYERDVEIYTSLGEYEKNRRRFAIQNLSTVEDSLIPHIWNSKQEIFVTPTHSSEHIGKFNWRNTEIKLPEHQFTHALCSIYNDNGSNVLFFGTGKESLHIAMWDSESQNTYRTVLYFGYKENSWNIDRVYRVGHKSFLLELISPEYTGGFHLLIGIDAIDFSHDMWNSIVESPFDNLQ